MSLPDRRIDPKILKSAEEEFMEKGFADASLREICKKAGVTTGAMYKRYPGKEALFEAVVGPTLQDIEEMALNIERYDYEQLAHGKMQSVWICQAQHLKQLCVFPMSDTMDSSYSCAVRKVQHTQISYMISYLTMRSKRSNF